MHWTTKTAIGAGITVVVTAVLVGGWATYRNTLKIPGLEEASARQQKDIAYLKVSMLTLMQKTGHPPAKEDLQNLISSVGEFGASTAHLVKSANIVITGRPLTYYAWVPPHAQDTLRRHVVTYSSLSSTNDPQVIGTMITSVMLSGDSGTWTFDGENVRGTFNAATVVLTPKDLTLKDLSPAYFGTWSKDANTLHFNLSTISTLKAPIPKHAP